MSSLVTGIGEHRKAREGRVAPSMTIPERRSALQLGAAGGLAWAAMWLPVPAFGRDASFGAWGSALDAGVTGLVAAVALYPLAWASARWGRRNVAVAALVVAAAAVLIAPLSFPIWRALMGLGAASAVLSGWLTDSISVDSRGRAQAGLDMGHALGAVLALVVGSFIPPAYPAAAFFLVAAALVAAHPKPPESECPRPPAAAELQLAAREPAFRPALAAAFALAFSAAAFFTQSPPATDNTLFIAAGAALAGMTLAARLDGPRAFALALALACAAALATAVPALYSGPRDALRGLGLPVLLFAFAAGQVALPAFVAARSAEMARPGVWLASQAASAAGLFAGAAASAAVHYARYWN